MRDIWLFCIFLQLGLLNWIMLDLIDVLAR